MLLDGVLPEEDYQPFGKRGLGLGGSRPGRRAGRG
jgi:hypothetical protein